MNSDLVNLARNIASQMRGYMVKDKRLWRSGNMRRSIAVIAIDEKTVDVVIATDYASYTNERGKWAGWVQKMTAQAVAAYCSARNVEDLTAFGIVTPKFTYGG